MNILECCSLNKIFQQGESAVYAVRDCNLKLTAGSFTVITGTSGSGKTTLLHLLAAFEKPTSGTVMIQNRDIYRLSEAELSNFRNTEIGFVFQSFHLLPILTAEENILMPGAIGKREVSKNYFGELCECLKISDRLHHFPRELSGGQQQRVAIARAMINRPKILFADEPTGNLDKNTAGELIDLLSVSNKRFGQTILMVTHDLGMTDIADAAYHMEDGILRRVK